MKSPFVLVSWLSYKLSITFLYWKSIKFVIKFKEKLNEFKNKNITIEIDVFTKLKIKDIYNCPTNVTYSATSSLSKSLLFTCCIKGTIEFINTFSSSERAFFCLNFS